jgi:gliding motility-associated-like protein
MYSNPSGIQSTAEVTGEIPSADITSAGVDYYVEVKDKTGNWWLSSGQSGKYSETSTPTVSQVSVDTVYSAVAGTGEQTITLPDGNSDDGNTYVSLQAGSLEEQAAISITQLSVSAQIQLNSAYPAAAFDFSPANQLFKKPVTVSLLYFDLDGDGIVDGTGIDETTLKIFHWDGFEWRLIGGQVNATLNTVTAGTMHFSVYALFQFSGSIELEDTIPLRKIVTPNGDGINDYAEFSALEPPYTVNIFNIRGRNIKSLDEDVSNPVWDGTDDDGDVVESGVYIYQIEKDGDIVTGIVTIAK